MPLFLLKVDTRKRKAQCEESSCSGILTECKHSHRKLLEKAWSFRVHTEVAYGRVWVSLDRHRRMLDIDGVIQLKVPVTAAKSGMGVVFLEYDVGTVRKRT